MIEAALEHARRYPNSVVALYQDEASFYRQPSQGWLWGLIGRRQPRMPLSCLSNSVVRAAGCLNALTGDTYVVQARKTDVPCLVKSYQAVLDKYPDALMIYMIQDNWPIHFHADILQFVADNPRLTILRLPTYAPRLNPIEKLWRWVRQKLCHAHEMCDNFGLYKVTLSARFVEAAQTPASILRYCGLDKLR